MAPANALRNPIGTRILSVQDLVGSASSRPGSRARSAPWRYGFALLTVMIAAALMGGWRGLGFEAPVAPFLAAILFTGWYAGAGPVVLATVLSVLVFDFLFLPPLFHVEFLHASHTRLVWFFGFACLAAWFSVARRRAARVHESARQDLEQRVAARTAELRRSEAYLLAAQRLSHTGSWARRIATGEIYWSEECFRIFGRDPKTTSLRRHVLTQLWHPHDREFAEQTIDAALREKRGFEIDARIVRPDGSIRHVHSLGQPVLGEAGEVVEFMGVIMDVTDRKSAERMLRRAREHSLQERFAAMLDERTRLAREMHDTLLQGFTGVALKLVAVTNRMNGPPEIVAALHDVIKLAQGTLEDARRAVWNMRAPARANGDLVTTLRAAAEDGVRGTRLGLEYVVEGCVRPLDPDVEAAVFRVAQEAVANVVQHAAARAVRLTLAYEERQLRLSVSDDGRGFAVDPDFRAPGGHWGLLGMRERASQVHGKFSVQSAPGHGTELVLLVPLREPRTPRPPTPSPENGGGNGLMACAVDG
jgi:PAS domain S-box-containing protein